MASRVILSNFFEKQLIQNHPQYLSGLSRALFPTTFLEIAVYLRFILIQTYRIFYFSRSFFAKHQTL